MLKFYYSLAPNPMKVALFLEEAGVEYEAIPVDTRKGEQHEAAFRSVNPNGKVPVIVDGDATVFDSNAILLYLGEKTGRFMPPAGSAARGELLSWLMFVATGIGPYSGQCVHFRNHAPEKLKYAIDRYTFEVQRHYEIVEKRLAGQKYMLGNDYTIVDMALWGWAQRAAYVIGAEAAATLSHFNRFMDEINARPAAARAASRRIRRTPRSSWWW